VRPLRRIQRFTPDGCHDSVPTVRTDTVTSLIVKDADGAKGAAEVRSRVHDTPLTLTLSLAQTLTLRLILTLSLTGPGGWLERGSAVRGLAAQLPLCHRRPASPGLRRAPAQARGECRTPHPAAPRARSRASVHPLYIRRCGSSARHSPVECVACSLMLLTHVAHSCAMPCPAATPPSCTPTLLHAHPPARGRIAFAGANCAKSSSRSEASRS
jgi:hypothetical protein